MVIDFSGGKMILSPFDLQVRLNHGVQLYAMVEDLKCHDEAIMLIADAGAVRWHLTLDNVQQLQQVKAELGLDYPIA